MIISISLHDKKDTDVIKFLKAGDKSAKVKQALRFWMKIHNNLETAILGGKVATNEEQPVVEVPLPELKKRELTKEEMNKKLDGMF